MSHTVLAYIRMAILVGVLGTYLSIAWTLTQRGDEIPLEITLLITAITTPLVPLVWGENSPLSKLTKKKEQQQEEQEKERTDG